ncbi:arsenate reductase (glutaredoxin) [Undibacterium sp. Di24W]|uniref:arsenate reductase (glutaredoxin) n=1 Tax=Undibacterium sp. Di24W TaxID=3413033 RepID=UPI003BF21F01
MAITIYHNPKCGTSRNTLALIRNTGVEPEIIEYLTEVPTKSRLQELIAAMAVPVRDVMRQKEKIYEDLQLADAEWSDDALIDFMLQHPILINRPIVVTDAGVRLCRPSEVVLEILTLPQRGAFSKEDGEQVIDATGLRVKPKA